MASSGSMRTNTIDDGTYFYVNWQQASQSISGNYTIINWQHGVHCRYNYYSNAIKSYGVNINGTAVYGGGTFSDLNAGDHQLASGTLRIYHNNDGTKSFNISTSGWALGAGDCSGSQNFTLNKINRIAITNSVTGSDIEQNFSVNYTKYLDTYQYKLRISIPNVTTLETIDNYISDSVFTLSQETIDSLYARYTTTNTFQLGFAVETWNNSTKISNGNEKIITAKITGANPIFTDFDYNDINPTTLALTGNSKYNINGYSTIRVSIDTTNKAVAQKGATMSKYQLIIGETTREMPYSDTETVNIDIPNSSLGEYKVYAIDSRNNSTLVTKLSLQNIAYEPLFIDYNSSSVERDNNGLGENVTLDYKGTIWNNSFGSVNNSIISATYEYKEVGSNNWITPSNPTSITPTITDNNMAFTGLIRSNEPNYLFDISKSYNVRITLEDKLSSYTLTLNPIPSGIPNISLNKNGVGIMCDYDETLGGDLQVSGVKFEPNNLIEDFGTSGIWTYMKYANGIAICFGIYTWNISSWTSWGNVYVSGDYQNTSYPFTFAETPMTFLTGANSGSNNTTGIGQSAGLNSTTTTPGFRFQRPTNGSAVTGAKMSILAIGKWK